MSFSHLLRRPTDVVLSSLSLAMKAISHTLPIPSKHKSDLPFAIRDLSRMLTQERGALNQSYWVAPRFLSAYVHYFLPWNLYRLAWLMPQLSIQLPEHAHIVDIGSGPLTMPIALWCTRPDLRNIPLTFHCYDVAAKPLEVGKNILQSLMGEDSKWSITVHRAPLDSAIAKLAVPVSLFMAGNVLNEISAAKQGTLEDRLAGIMRSMATKLATKGQVLLIEPGTRLGGKTVVLSRKGALQAGLTPLAPCTHVGPCPMIEQPLYSQFAPQYSGWCHYLYPATEAPQNLVDLGKRAGFEKDNLALSCLFLEKTLRKSENAKDDFWQHQTGHDDLASLEALYQDMMEETSFDDDDDEDDEISFVRVAGDLVPQPENLQEKVTVRVISDLIRLPDAPEPARYACSKYGLVLLQNALHCYPGGAIEAKLVADNNGNALRDKKTSALIMFPAHVYAGKIVDVPVYKGKAKGADLAAKNDRFAERTEKRSKHDATRRDERSTFGKEKKNSFAEGDKPKTRRDERKESQAPRRDRTDAPHYRERNQQDAPREEKSKYNAPRGEQANRNTTRNDTPNREAWRNRNDADMTDRNGVAMPDAPKDASASGARKPREEKTYKGGRSNSPKKKNRDR